MGEVSAAVEAINTNFEAISRAVMQLVHVKVLRPLVLFPAVAEAATQAGLFNIEFAPDLDGPRWRVLVSSLGIDDDELLDRAGFESRERFGKDLDGYKPVGPGQKNPHASRLIAEFYEEATRRWLKRHPGTPQQDLAGASLPAR